MSKASAIKPIGPSQRFQDDEQSMLVAATGPDHEDKEKSRLEGTNNNINTV